mmetsp:Transcript_61908/g.122453  ORF Transcript_61908/g.122453 Transcript_61908/m.122453 type:complete len:225 (+) Transcript_61908:147-821(+)
MVGFLRDHIQNVAEALRAPLPPGLVNTERHVFRTLLPTKQLHICLALINTLGIVKLRAWEDTDHLRKLHNTLCQRCRAMLQVLKRLLVHLRVKHVMHCIHLRFPVLFVHVALLLHLTDGIAVLLDVHLVRCTLNRQAINFFAQLQNVALVFTQSSLHATHAKVQGAESARGLGTAELCLLLNSTNLLKRLLLLLADVILQACFSVGHVPLQVAPDNGYFIEAIA